MEATPPHPAWESCLPRNSVSRMKRRPLRGLPQVETGFGKDGGGWSLSTSCSRGLAACTVLALRSQCFCWRLQETKQSQGQLRRGDRVLPQSGLEARQSWAGTETPTPNLFCQPLAFRERWRGAGLETRAAACYSQTQPWIERVAPSTRVGAGR